MSRPLRQSATSQAGPIWDGVRQPCIPAAALSSDMLMPAIATNAETSKLGLRLVSLWIQVLVQPWVAGRLAVPSWLADHPGDLVDKEIPSFSPRLGSS